MKQFILASAAALALLAPGAASAATNLLTNGSFEQTTGQFEGWGGWTFYAGGPNLLPGWTVNTPAGAVNTGSVDVTNALSGWSPASDGANSLDINGWDAGEIEQSFDTIVGKLYTVTFDYSRNAAGAPDPATATVSAGAGSFDVNAPYDTALFGVVGGMLWQSGSFTFVGTGHDTLKLTATVPGNGGVYFDHLSVAGVPEPASWALLIGGFGMAGAALRRRRTAVAAAA